MTVLEFLEDLEKQPLVVAPSDWKNDYIRFAAQAMEVWTNNACLGYALAGAGAARFTKEQTKRLVSAMKAAFDEMTLAEAESYYMHGTY